MSDYRQHYRDGLRELQELLVQALDERDRAVRALADSVWHARPRRGVEVLDEPWAKEVLRDE